MVDTRRATFKYRLYPTRAQRSSMQKALGACRWVYNKTLEVRKTAWEQEQRSVSRYDTIKMLPDLKKEHSFLDNAHSQSLQEVCNRVDLAFQAFFRRIKSGEKPGYPRFRGCNRYSSFTYPQSGFKFMPDGCLRLAKIGSVKIKLHRPILGQIKTLTIRRNALGHWYACFSCVIEAKPLPPSPNTVGVDVGIAHFATLSTGEQIPNPCFFRKDEKALGKAQRQFSKYAKGTPERNKYRQVVRHIHNRIANRRTDFAHKLSRRLVNEFQIIVLEDLNIQDMQRDNFPGMNKSIADAAWYQFRQYTAYKAEDAGRSCIVIDPRNTSQICSSCGQIVRKDLSERVHKCSRCGLVMDRDLNASLNILARGLACVQADSSVTGRSRATLVAAE